MNTPNKINDGGPAFPSGSLDKGPHHCNDTTTPGMSLRAYCAVKVLPALVSLVTAEDMKKFTPEQYHKRCARGAVLLADALIAELEKPA